MTRNAAHSNARSKRVTYFIADLHLAERTPRLNATFQHFLTHQARHADAVYILGDLYNYWLGDDQRDAFAVASQQQLRQLTQAGIPTYFIHGNRDFLIGKRFAKHTGITLLPANTLINIYQTPALIMHGDSLCTDDHWHQLYRKIAYHPLIKMAAPLLPLTLRETLAKKLRNQSQQHQQRVADYILDANPQTVTKTMQRYNVQLLIHGHTHRPAIHQIVANNQPAKRIVLGAWHNKGSVLACYADGHMALQDLPLT